MTHHADTEADAVLIKRLLREAMGGWELDLSERQLDQLSTHFALLVQWNRKINLTSLRRPEEIATRHFGESLWLAKVLGRSEETAEGLLIDVGSGAGFPGLPLKTVWPSLPTILLEPNQKKAAFLKEVARRCGIEGVEIRTDRLEEAVRGDCAGRASLVTIRAVAATKDFVRDLRKLLRRDGQLALFIGATDADDLAKAPGFQWLPPVPIPHSERRVILIGRNARI